MLEVALVPNPGAGFDPMTFYLGLKKTGSGGHTQWLVDYWMPHWAPPVPKNPN
jgi:hypothetical protein